MNSKQTFLENVLQQLGFSGLNEMQDKAFETILKSKETLILSPTGSGKTLAFLLPIIFQLKAKNNATQVLVLVPSRELALQIESVFKSLKTEHKITCCYGGHHRSIEDNNLKQAPAIIVGTPGRIADHIRRDNIQLETITTLIIDEFDKSLEFGFHDEMSFIIGELRNLSKKVLTSATISIEIPDFLEADSWSIIDHISEQKDKDNLAIKFVRSHDKDKLKPLLQLICALGNKSSIIFCNHREAVERISSFLKENKIVSVFYHGALDQIDREIALCKFKNGSSNILVATDLAARGLDIAQIQNIIHFQLPGTEADFIHRNGRTARMEKSGQAILMLSPEEYLPNYISNQCSELQLSNDNKIPNYPEWETLFIAAGKKNKVNKIDILGFLTNVGQLKKEDVGLIESKDFSSFVAIKKTVVASTMKLVKDQKIKNQKVKIAIAR